jgi:hypothetical protein
MLKGVVHGYCPHELTLALQEVCHASGYSAVESNESSIEVNET